MIRRTLPRAVLQVAILFFVALCLTLLTLGDVPLDRYVRDVLLGAASPAVVAVMRLVNLAGDIRLLAPGTLALFIAFREARRYWWIWLGLMVSAPLAEGLLKITIGRQRPDDMSMGFPSGHATAAAAFFGAIIYLSRSLSPRARGLVRAGAVAVIVLVALARVLLRAHWPSDALGGVALGLGLASLAALLTADAATPDAGTDVRPPAPAPRRRARETDRA